MTPTQRKALEFVGTFLRTPGVAPSLEEIAVGLGRPRTSKGAVHQLVKRLEERGYLTREAGARSARSLRLTEAGRRAIPEVSLAGVPTSALYAELERRRATERPHG